MTADPLRHSGALAWPSGQPRHAAETRLFAPWRADGVPITLPRAIERLTTQLRLLDARTPILHTNVPLRRDELPSREHTKHSPHDAGAACYFALSGRPMVLACDRWATVAGNIAGIASHIQALRGMERWGVGTIEQAFAGYAALPPPAADDWTRILDKPEDLAEAEATYRRKMRTAHPDAGGSEAAAALLNLAIARARKELK